MDKFSLEQIQGWGFRYVNDGNTETYWELVLGKDYWNDDFIYAEKIGMNQYRIYDGKTNEPLSQQEVNRIIQEMEG